MLASPDPMLTPHRTPAAIQQSSCKPLTAAVLCANRSACSSLPAATVYHPHASKTKAACVGQTSSQEQLQHLAEHTSNAKVTSHTARRRQWSKKHPPSVARHGPQQLPESVMPQGWAYLHVKPAGTNPSQPPDQQSVRPPVQTAGGAPVVKQSSEVGRAAGAVCKALAYQRKLIIAASNTQDAAYQVLRVLRCAHAIMLQREGLGQVPIWQPALSTRHIQPRHGLKLRGKQEMQEATGFLQNFPGRPARHAPRQCRTPSALASQSRSRHFSGSSIQTAQNSAAVSSSMPQAAFEGGMPKQPTHATNGGPGFAGKTAWRMPSCEQDMLLPASSAARVRKKPALTAQRQRQLTQLPDIQLLPGNTSPVPGVLATQQGSFETALCYDTARASVGASLQHPEQQTAALHQVPRTEHQHTASDATHTSHSGSIVLLPCTPAGSSSGVAYDDTHDVDTALQSDISSQQLGRPQLRRQNLGRQKLRSQQEGLQGPGQAAAGIESRGTAVHRDVGRRLRRAVGVAHTRPDPARRGTRPFLLHVHSIAAGSFWPSAVLHVSNHHTAARVAAMLCRQLLGQPTKHGESWRQLAPIPPPPRSYITSQAAHTQPPPHAHTTGQAASAPTVRDGGSTQGQEQAGSHMTGGAAGIVALESYGKQAALISLQALVFARRQLQRQHRDLSVVLLAAKGYDPQVDAYVVRHRFVVFHTALNNPSALTPGTLRVAHAQPQRVWAQQRSR